PGSMSRQRKGKQIVVKGTKKAVEEYFANEFQIEDLWDKKKRQKNYDQWHKCQVKKLSEKVVQKKKGNRENKDDAISAKLLDTFMHQLMKYKEFRYLYKYLHLPLDGQVFKNLARELKEIENPQSLKELQDLAQEYENQAYTLNYAKYKKIQEKLNCLQKYLNKVLKSERVKLESRVELNCILWSK
ncbi:unnamed protein product, partial [marine sediment metagenome]